MQTLFSLGSKKFAPRVWRRVEARVWVFAALGLSLGASASPKRIPEMKRFELPTEVRQWGAPTHLNYRLYSPPHEQRTPLVVALHGCDQDSRDFIDATQILNEAKNRGFHVFLPEQSLRAHPLRCWNWYDPDHQMKETGELAQIAEGLRQLRDAELQNVSPRQSHVQWDRVYAMGLSAGAAHASGLAFCFPEIFRGFAQHSGPAFSSAGSAWDALQVLRLGPWMRTSRLAHLANQCSPTTPRSLSALFISGSADTVVHSNNTRSAIEQVLEFNRSVLRLPLSLPIQTESSPLTSTHYPAHLTSFHLTRSAGAPAVHWIKIDGLAHAWSGGQTTHAVRYQDPKGPSALKYILDFFEIGPPQATHTDSHRGGARHSKLNFNQDF